MPVRRHSQIRLPGPITIGPLPITSTFFISLFCGIGVTSYHADEFIEKKICVVRAGACLGVELHGKGFFSRIVNSLARVVVYVYITQSGIFRKRVRQNRIAVILAGDINALRFQILDGLIHAAVPVLKLRRFSAARKRQYLMPETDSENRDFSDNR